MIQFSEKNTKDLFKQHKIQPLKRLGQNFLIDRTAIRKIIEAADIDSKDIVLEIGPGPGVLTQELAQRARKVITVEKDFNMVEILKESLKEFDNVEVIQGDIRKIQIPELKAQDYKIVANLPFYLTAPIIRRFLEADNPPEQMTLVVQKEVGQRICAKPSEMSILAVSVQFYAEPKIISYIPKRSFWPSPEVDTAIIKICRKPSQPAETDRDIFFKTVKAGFSQPRKQLVNNLSKGLKIGKKEAETWLLKNKIQPSQRAETLNVEDWVNLARSFQP